MRMNKRTTQLIMLLLLLVTKVSAQEKLLYSAGFNTWAEVALNATTGATPYSVVKQTDYSKENLTFTLTGATLLNAARYTYSGYIRLAKNSEAPSVTPAIELSKLASISKVIFYHGATGSSRGLKLLMKNDGDATWTALSETFTNSAGSLVTINIPEAKQANVRLRFENLAPSQYADLVHLEIWGNYTPTATVYELTTSTNITNAGIINRSPTGTEFETGTEVSLTAVPNFGYSFVKWVDANNADNELSLSNPYKVTMNAAKHIKAVFQAKTTYSFRVDKLGSDWGEVSLSPAPNSGRYEAGTEVTVRIVPNLAATFSKWEDNSTIAQRVITVDGDKVLTATFDEAPFIVGWGFKTDDVRQSKPADYYASSNNVGSISVHENNGAKVNWLYNNTQLGGTPNVRLWTTNLTTTPRYLQAQFSTVGYQNIELRSSVSATTHAYAIVTLQYSIDGVNFTEIGRVDITNAFNTSWVSLNKILPADAENKNLVYLRWIADPNSPELGAGNDGTAFSNIFVFANKQVVNDTEAPVLVSTVPVNGSSSATVNGNIVLTFNETVKVGVGEIKLGNKTITGVFGSKTVTFPYEKLTYNTSYTVTVPNGALTDISGNAYAGTTFTFTTANRTEPAKKVYDAVVAMDGSGGYLNVIDAIAAAPTGRTIPWVIFIKNGTYPNHHDIPANKPFIHLIGQSRDGVIITDNRLSGDDGQGTPYFQVNQGATMVVNSANCYFENITFENAAGYVSLKGPQALALYTIGDKFGMKNCYLRSFQDTYLTGYNNPAARRYVLKSKIEGAVDFLYGDGNIFFDQDTLAINRSTGGYIVAPSHQNGTDYGYVFDNNIITKAAKIWNVATAAIVNENSVNVITYLGRAWQNSPKTVFINTKLGNNLSLYPQGWYYKMNAIPSVFADYGTVNTNGQPVDVSQRIENYEYDVKDGNGVVINTVTGVAKKSLTDVEAASYTYENVILKSGDDWDPRLIAEAPELPKNVSISNNVLSWDVVNYARLYVITRNKVVIGFSLTNEYTDHTAVQGNNYTYEVQASSEYGALSLASTATQVLPITGLTFHAKKIGSSGLLSWSTLTETNTSHFELHKSRDGVNFSSIGRVAAAGESAVKRSYTFTDTYPISGYNYYIVRAVDKDGKFSESSVAVLNFDLKNQQAIVFPNPSNGVEFNLELLLEKNEKIQMQVTAMDGRVVYREIAEWAAGNTIKKVQLPNRLAKGLYVIRLSGELTSHVMKLMVK